MGRRTDGISAAAEPPRLRGSMGVAMTAGGGGSGVQIGSSPGGAGSGAGRGP